MTTAPLKRCGCGRAYADRAAWRALPLVGEQDDGVEVLQYRNCPCGSTLAVALATGPLGYQLARARLAEWEAARAAGLDAGELYAQLLELADHLDRADLLALRSLVRGALHRLAPGAGWIGASP